MTDDNEQTIKVTEPVHQIGSRLRKTREAKNLEISEVARQLKLSTDAIKKVEADDWSELHGRAYVRGYISNYAKLLGLPADDLLISFDANYADDDHTHSSPILAQEKKMNLRWLPAMVSILIVVGVLGLAYQLWQQYQQEKTLTDVEENAGEAEDLSSAFLPENVLFTKDRSKFFVAKLAYENNELINSSLGMYLKWRL